MFKNLLDKGKCALGYHAGDWRYATEGKCKQVQVCERCQKESFRTQHAWGGWDYDAPSTCARVRMCARCAEEEHDLVHTWREPAYLSAQACDQVQVCERCQERQEAPPAHVWGEWVYLAADGCMQAQLCDRCGKLSERERAVHRWGEWRYSEAHRQAIHTCERCGELGARSDFALLEEEAYEARVWSPPTVDKKVPGIASLLHTGDLSASDWDRIANPAARKGKTNLTEEKERELTEAVERGNELQYLFGMLQEQYQKEQDAGKINAPRRDLLDDIMGEINQMVHNRPSDLEGMISESTRLRDLMQRMSGALTDPSYSPAITPPAAGSRAARILPLMRETEQYIVAEIAHSYNKSGEFDYLGNLQTRFMRARDAIHHAEDDGTTFKLEQETIRQIALDVRAFAQRNHLTLASRIWDTPSTTPNPNAVFFSGTDTVGRLVADACRQNHLTLLPARGQGDRTRFRYQQLQTCHVAIFDLSAYNRKRELENAKTLAGVGYELGIAFALGRPVVIVGQAGRTLPFDVDVEPIYLEHDGKDVVRLADALDHAIYSRQRGGGGSSVDETVTYLRRTLADHPNRHVGIILNTVNPDVVKDAVKTRHIVANALSTAGTDDHHIIHPSWAGAYPDPTDRRCFHVTGFREWTKQPSEVVRKACKQAGVRYKRGDEVLNPDIIRTIWDEICRATHVVVDLSGLNINTVLELGMAHVLGRNAILVGQDIAGIAPTFPAIVKKRMHRYSLDDDPGIHPLRDALNRFLASG